jgi:hypothetical protein
VAAEFRDPFRSILFAELAKQHRDIDSLGKIIILELESIGLVELG